MLIHSCKVVCVVSASAGASGTALAILSSTRTRFGQGQVMLRITEVREKESSVTLRLEGQVVFRWVGELDRELKRVLKNERTVVLDFAAVSYVSRHGAEMLRSHCGRKLRIENCSALIRDLLSEGRR